MYIKYLCVFTSLLRNLGSYERDEVKTSIEVATQITEALTISLDYLMGATDLLLDKNVIKKIQGIQQLDSEN